MLTALKAIFRLIARSLAAIFAILFVIVTVLVLLLLNIERTMFDAETYKRALAENKIYQQLPALAADEMAKMKSFLANPCAASPLGCAIDGASPELRACLTEILGQEAYVAIGSGRRNPTEAELRNSQPCLDQDGGAEEPLPTSGGGQMAFLNTLTAEDWQALLSVLLPPELLQPMTENVLDQVFTYLNGEADSARISLAPLKKQLTGQASQEALKILLAAQPACIQEQLSQMTVIISTGKGGLALCAPPKETLDWLLPEMQVQLSALVARMPDEAVIIKPPSRSAPPGNGGPLGNDPPAVLRKIHLGIRLSPLLPLGLLLLVTLFGVRSLKGWLRWWGVPMFIAGLIAFCVAIASQPALDWAWVTYIVVRIPPLVSASIPEIGHELARFLVQDLMKWIMLEAGMLGLLGLAAIVSSFFIKTVSKEVDLEEYI